MIEPTISYHATPAQKYDPAMQVTDQDEADAYFAALVARRMEEGHSREAAEEMERKNLGYWAGYYDNETRERVERLFRCQHPYFGSIAENGPPPPEVAFRMGYNEGKKSRQLEKTDV